MNASQQTMEQDNVTAYVAHLIAAYLESEQQKKRKIRLSHSTLDLLHTCERKFQIERLLAGGGEREESEHLSFGHCFGEGIAEYLVSQDKEAALYKAWLAYWPQVETDKKNQAEAINALNAAFGFLDNILQEYEVVSFEGKPAVELSFRLDIDETYYFVGYVDVVLRNRWTGKYCIFEVKTTGLAIYDLAPLYVNSGQALGYSVALDKIVGEEVASYDVIYFVAQLGKDYSPKIHIIPFSKTLLDRLNWFLTLGLDVKHLREMAELNVYPKRGSNCLQYNKPCRQYGTCGLHAFDTPAPIVEDTVEYQFVYTMDELIADHLRRLSQPQPEQAVIEELP